MLGFLQKIGAGLMKVLGLGLPVVRQAREAEGLARGVRIVLHVLLLAAILVGLYLLDERVLKIYEHVKVGGLFERFKGLWLPILFFLVYAFCWLSWWLWKLL